MKKKLLIVLSIIFVLIICTAVGIVSMKNKDDKLKENENIVSSGVEWGDLYIKYLKDNRGKNLLNVAKNKNLDMLISFIQLNPDDKPIMICQFEYKDLLEDKTEITMYCKVVANIVNGKVESTEWGTSDNAKFMYLYNIKENSYQWYALEENEYINNYYPMDKFIEFHNNGNKYTPDTYDEFKREFYKDVAYYSVYSNTEKSNSNSDVYNFSDIFIEIDNVENHGDTVHFGKNFDEINKEIVKIVNDKYESINDVVTNERKNEIDEKVNSKTNNLNKENQDRSENVIKVGDYTLRFGKYIGYAESYDYTGVTKEEVTCTINKDGTAEYNGVSGTYTVSGNIININGTPLVVTGNDKMELQVAGGVVFNYLGHNETAASSNNTATNVTNNISSASTNSQNSGSVAKDLETATKNAITETVKTDSSILVKNLQNNLHSKYKIVGVYTPSGGGVLSVKNYIEPSTTLPSNQANMSVANSVDYLIIYDSDANKEYRVRIFRQSNPPTASCSEDSEITK